MIKKTLKKILPKSLITRFNIAKSRLSLISEFLYDYKIYNEHNASQIKLNIDQIEGRIIAHYHVLEKGLSHPTPKKCFSLPIVENLIKLLEEYDSLTLQRSQQVNVAISVLKKYQTYSSNITCLPESLSFQIDRLLSHEVNGTGFIEFTNEFYFKSSQAKFDDFAASDSLFAILSKLKLRQVY